MWKSVQFGAFKEGQNVMFNADFQRTILMISSRRQ